MLGINQERIEELSISWININSNEVFLLYPYRKPLSLYFWLKLKLVKGVSRLSYCYHSNIFYERCVSECVCVYAMCRLGIQIFSNFISLEMREQMMQEVIGFIFSDRGKATCHIQHEHRRAHVFIDSKSKFIQKFKFIKKNKEEKIRKNPSQLPEIHPQTFGERLFYLKFADNSIFTFS